jgi:hypothetical protein
VIPGFMTDPADAAALRRATGLTSPDSGQPVLRDLNGLAIGPVSVVYRSFLLRGSDYGLGSDAILTDDHGRPIRLVEGLAFRQPESAVRGHGITSADLDRARAAVTSAYQAFWSDGAAFSRRASAPLGAGGNGEGPALPLDIGEPWGTPEKVTVPTPGSPPGRPAPEPSLSGATDTGPAPSRAPAAPPVPAVPPTSRRHHVRPVHVLVVATVAVLTAILIVLIINLTSSGPTPHKPQPHQTSQTPGR